MKDTKEEDLDDSGDGARSYALLSYGKNGGETSIHPMSCATPWP